jgi:hypothetical protein
MIDTKDKLRDAGIEAGTRRSLGQAGARPLDELALDKDIAEAMLGKLRSAFPTTGLWPVIWGPDVPIDQCLDTFKRTEGDIERDLAAATAIDALEWLAARRKARHVTDPDAIGRWPTNIKRWEEGLEALCAENIRILLVPAAHAWHVPVILGFGGFNDCPEPAELCALLRHWKELYGADPASFGAQASSCDVLELTVENPPLDKPGAIALAKDLFIVADHEMMTPAELAAQLVARRTWLLWWD